MMRSLETGIRNDLFGFSVETHATDHGTILERFANLSCGHGHINSFRLSISEPKCALGDPILYPESIF